MNQIKVHAWRAEVTGDAAPASSYQSQSSQKLVFWKDPWDRALRCWVLGVLTPDPQLSTIQGETPKGCFWLASAVRFYTRELQLGRPCSSQAGNALARCAAAESEYGGGGAVPGSLLGATAGSLRANIEHKVR